MKLIYKNSNLFFSDFIQPICLPIPMNRRYLDAKDTMPYVAGWGSTSPSRSFCKNYFIINYVIIHYICNKIKYKRSR